MRSLFSALLLTVASVGVAGQITLVPLDKRLPQQVVCSAGRADGFQLNHVEKNHYDLTLVQRGAAVINALPLSCHFSDDAQSVLFICVNPAQQLGQVGAVWTTLKTSESVTANSPRIQSIKSTSVELNYNLKVQQGFAQQTVPYNYMSWPVVTGCYAKE